MKRLLLIFSLVIFASTSFAQNYSIMQWGLATNVSPYAFGANINGTWRDLGTVSASGIWNIFSNNVSLKILSVLDYGADPTGINNSTIAINNALSAAAGRVVYVPPGNYRLDDTITIPSGTTLQCSGRTTTNFLVNSTTFNMTANGVITFSLGDAVGLNSCAVSFTQPDTAIRANVIQYPPAIYAVNSTRFNIKDVRINSSYKCLNATGNTGGSTIDNLECGALANNESIAFDGALDFVHINRLECWPFGMSATTNLFPSVYSDQTTNCLTIGKVDGLAIDTVSALTTSVVITSNAGNTAIPYQISNLQLDANSYFRASAGRIYISNFYSTTDSNSINPSLSVDSPFSYVYVSNLDNQVDTSPICNISATGGGHISITNGKLWHTDTASAAGCVSGSFSFLSVKNIFATINPQNRSVAYFTQTGTASLEVKNVTFSGNGGATGNVINFASDSVYNSLGGNVLGGWSVGLPSSISVGQYEVSNAGVTTNANATVFNSGISVGVGGSTVGSVAFRNATSGTITLQPTTGALGTVTATLPANTGTIAETNLAQTFSATQTFTAPIVLASYTIGALPTCNAGALGSIVTVSNGTDYATGTYGSAVSATGIVTRSVLCTNTAGATTYAWAYN